jgi:hypothetical protein
MFRQYVQLRKKAESVGGWLTWEERTAMAASLRATRRTRDQTGVNGPAYAGTVAGIYTFSLLLVTNRI